MMLMHDLFAVANCLQTSSCSTAVFTTFCYQWRRCITDSAVKMLTTNHKPSLSFTLHPEKTANSIL